LTGAGKSTHLQWLKELLETRGMKVRATREPGGTLLGERLRELLLDREQQARPGDRDLLMFAARREHLETVILPELDTGTWILCDRFTDASYAYQSGGSGVDWTKVAALEQWVHPGFAAGSHPAFRRESGGRPAAGAAGRDCGPLRAGRAGVLRARARRPISAGPAPARSGCASSTPGGSLDVVRRNLEEVVAALCSGVT
jgi:hypothetical protein